MLLFFTKINVVACLMKGKNDEIPSRERPQMRFSDPKPLLSDVFPDLIHHRFQTPKEDY